MKISVKPNRKKQIYCYFFTLPPNTPFHILNKNAECFTAETMHNIMVSMWYIAINVLFLKIELNRDARKSVKNNLTI